MNRRRFLIGAGGIAIGGSALLGSGAFSRVESHRQVSVQVANDADAYLGLLPGDSPNGDNYVEEDEHGHIEVDIGENPNGGEGVNSNSLTFFDNLVEVCNQGKEDIAVWLQAEPFTDDSGAAAGFYTGTAQGSQGTGGIELVHGVDNAIDVPLGECAQLGLLVDTGGKFFDEAEKVDATEEDTIIDVDARITADVGIEEEDDDDDDDDDDDPVGSEINITELDADSSNGEVEFTALFEFTQEGDETATFLSLEFDEDDDDIDLSDVDDDSASVSRDGTDLDVASAAESGDLEDTVVIELEDGDEITPDDSDYEVALDDVESVGGGTLTLGLHEADNDGPVVPAFAEDSETYEI